MSNYTKRSKQELAQRVANDHPHEDDGEEAAPRKRRRRRRASAGGRSAE